jgi:hypothetical protein
MQISQYKFIAEGLSIGSAEGHQIVEERAALYPRTIVSPSWYYLGAAQICRVAAVGSDGCNQSEATVVVALWHDAGREEVAFWCGDKFLDAGRVNAPTTKRFAL